MPKLVISFALLAAILNSIEYAKNEHTRWRTYAEAKFNGLEVSEELIPTKHTECECGKWILEKGQILYHIKSSDSLSKDHIEFHNLYEKLYEFINNNKTGNIFNRSVLKKKNGNIMNSYAVTLKSLSDNILKSYDNIFTEIEQTPEDKINSLFNN